MEEAPENSKELSNSAHANGMNERNEAQVRPCIPLLSYTLVL